MRIVFVASFSLFACLLWAPVAQASPAAPTCDVKCSQPHLSLATDAWPWFLDGFSLIGSYESDRFPRLRFHGEVFGITLPTWLSDTYEPNRDEGWSRRIDWAAMLSFDHHPLVNLEGFHWGAGVNLHYSTVMRTGRSETFSYETIEPILRLGYQWFPLREKGLFITPYLAVGFPIHLRDLAPIDGETYEEAAMLPLGSIQIGWRLPLTR